jgi:hypothetical protein
MAHILFVPVDPATLCQSWEQNRTPAYLEMTLNYLVFGKVQLSSSRT